MARALRIVGYNILEGGGDRLGRIAGVLQNLRPDAVALLEASHDSASELAERLELELAFGEGNRPRCHVAWLSRMPIRKAENHRLPALAKTLLELEVEWDGAPLGLYAAHLASSQEKHAYPRAIEIQAILSVLAGRATRPHALVGDLNALHPDDPVGVPPPGIAPRGEAVAGADRPIIPRIVEAGYVDCFRSIHPGEPGYTYQSGSPWLRLDYVFASPGLAWRLVACDVITGPDAAAASDHLPVVAEFA